MSDDKSKRDYHDRDRINRHEEYEVEYWKNKFGVTRQQLIDAIDAVGPMVADVKKHLGK